MISAPFITDFPLMREPYHAEGNESGAESQWSTLHPMAAECEVLHFLRALVILLKPETIVETGTCFGHSAAAMAQGCQANGLGRVITFEINPQLVEYARVFLANNGLTALVDVVQGDATSHPFGKAIDLLYVDGGDERIKELTNFAPYLSRRGVVVIHDAHNTAHYHWEELPDTFDKLYLPCPRGLWILRPRKV